MLATVQFIIFSLSVFLKPNENINVNVVLYDYETCPLALKQGRCAVEFGD
jgi:hypothetical protein